MFPHYYTYIIYVLIFFAFLFTFEWYKEKIYKLSDLLIEKKNFYVNDTICMFITSLHLVFFLALGFFIHHSLNSIQIVNKDLDDKTNVSFFKETIYRFANGSSSKVYISGFTFINNSPDTLILESIFYYKYETDSSNVDPLYLYIMPYSWINNLPAEIDFFYNDPPDRILKPKHDFFHSSNVYYWIHKYGSH